MSDTLASSESITTWASFFTALFIIEAFLLTTFRLFPNFWGSLINVWYDKFGMTAIMLDILIVLIGFWITQKLYSYLFGSSFILWKFILLFLFIQIIHDILFYVLILKNSNGSNAILDLINSYGNKHGIYTILGDSLMVLLTICLAWIIINSNINLSTYIICILLSVYFIGYLLYMKWI